MRRISLHPGAVLWLLLLAACDDQPDPLTDVPGHDTLRAPENAPRLHNRMPPQRPMLGDDSVEYFIRRVPPDGNAPGTEEENMPRARPDSIAGVEPLRDSK